jgi:hypothetical protein
MESKENSTFSNSRESSRQEMPQILELTRIMLRDIFVENAGKMSLGDRHVFCSMTNELLCLADSMS